MRKLIFTAALLGAVSIAMPAQAGRAGGGMGGHVGGGHIGGGGFNGGGVKVNGGSWHGGGIRGGGFGGGYFGGWNGGGFGNNGSWYAIIQAPGGWNSYYRPVNGWTLPNYWNSSAFYVDDWRSRKLRKPRTGYRWSRYYNDAVLVDSYGRIIDVEYDVNWGSGYGAGRPGAPYNGAYADGAYGRGYAGDYRYPSGGYDDRATYNNDYDGRWEGTWYGNDGRSYSGTYEGSYRDADAPPHPVGEPGVSYAPPARYAPPPAASLPPVAYASPAYGYGYGYAPPVVTSTTTTTTTEYIEETVSQPRVAKAKRRVYRRCTC